MELIEQGEYVKDGIVDAQIKVGVAHPCDSCPEFQVSIGLAFITGYLSSANAREVAQGILACADEAEERTKELTDAGAGAKQQEAPSGDSSSPGDG